MEVLEPHAHRAVAVLEPGGHKPVLHLGHFGADGDHQPVGRTGGEDRVPGAAQPLAYRPGPEHVGSSAGGDDHRPRPEDVELVLPYGESHGAGDAVGLVGVGQQVGDAHPLVEVLRPQSRAGRLGGDGLDGLAVDRYLPPADAFVFAVFPLPDGQPPFLQQVDGVIHVAADVIDEVFPGQPHHVVDHVADEVFRGVPPEALAHVTIDGGQAFAGGPAAFDGGFLHHDDPGIAAPILGLKGSPAAGHAAADDQNVAVNCFRCRQRHISTPKPRIRKGKQV